MSFVDWNCTVEGGDGGGGFWEALAVQVTLVLLMIMSVYAIPLPPLLVINAKCPVPSSVIKTTGY